MRTSSASLNFFKIEFRLAHLLTGVLNHNVMICFPGSFQIIASLFRLIAICLFSLVMVVTNFTAHGQAAQAAGSNSNSNSNAASPTVITAGEDWVPLKAELD